MIAQARAVDTRDFRHWRRPRDGARHLVYAQTRERIARQLGIALRLLPYQFEKQRKRARRMLMLQCTMLRE